MVIILFFYFFSPNIQLDIRTHFKKKSLQWRSGTFASFVQATSPLFLLDQIFKTLQLFGAILIFFLGGGRGKLAWFSGQCGRGALSPPCPSLPRKYVYWQDVVHCSIDHRENTGPWDDGWSTCIVTGVKVWNLTRRIKNERDAYTKLTHILKKGIGVKIMLKCTVFVRIWGKLNVFFQSTYGPIDYDRFFLESRIYMSYLRYVILFFDWSSHVSVINHISG